jgi:aminoglycoside/choline kinase family phosphotransferase
MPASNDASFRRYFRVLVDDKSFIAMDAPPDKEDVATFLRIGTLFKQAGVNTPIIFNVNIEDGFILLEDFGTQWLLNVLQSQANATAFYKEALHALLPLQTSPLLLNADLPFYSEALLRQEMHLFEHWFVEQLLDINLPVEMWQSVQQCLVASALAQPVVCVHRDYHSRNLMVLTQNELGILDFQDAVLGPITYDMVSLLRDCYIAWPTETVASWLNADYERLLALKIVQCDFAQFKYWFDLMGMQRHLKAVGIFARLHLRDDKSHYLSAIPRTLGYLQQVSATYPFLASFEQFLQEIVLPR